MSNQRALAALAQRLATYARIVVWFDPLDRADTLVEQLREAGPFRQKEIQGVASHQDANAYLMEGSRLDFWREIA